MFTHLYRSTLLCLFLLLSACGGSSGSSGSSGSTDSSDQFVYEYSVPSSTDDGWQVAHLDDVGISEPIITRIVKDIHNGDFPRIDSIAIARDGFLVLDHRFRTELDEVDEDTGNTNINFHSMQSVTKSVVSALVGITIDQGLIPGVDDSFYSYFTEYSSFDNWAPPKNDITIADVLTMRHGLEWDESTYPYSDSRNTLSYVYSFTDVVKAVLDLPMANTPGEAFAYSTGVSIAIGEMVANASGQSVEEYADEYLFEPLGITQRLWFYTSSDRANTGSGLFLTTRDMAKFGQLYLDDGWWNGQKIISSEWIELSTEKQLDDTGYESIGYAMHWWTISYNIGGELVDIYFAAGNGGQLIFVISDLNTVVIFTAHNYTWRENDEQYRDDPYAILREYILPAIEGT